MNFYDYIVFFSICLIFTGIGFSGGLFTAKRMFAVAFAKEFEKVLPNEELKKLREEIESRDL